MKRITKKKYLSKEEITKQEIVSWLKLLSPVSEKEISKIAWLDKEKIEFKDKNLLFNMLEDDIAFEEYIALEVYRMFKDIILKDFFWEIHIENIDPNKSFFALKINLVFESLGIKRGRILFPITIIRGLDNNYYYWEVLIDKDTAVESLTLFTSSTNE